MDEISFELNGERIRLTSEQVRRAVEGMIPEQIWNWSVLVDGVNFPVKQVFRAAIEREHFNSQTAVRHLKRLGFVVSHHESPAADGIPRFDDDDEIGEHADATRLAALNAAIGYASTRPHLDVNGVLSTAEAIDVWLRASREVQ